MTIQIIQKENLGNSLVVTSDAKLEVKPDTTGNVTLSVSDKGLKGEVKIPTAVEKVDIKNGKVIVKYVGNAVTTDIDLPKAPVDIKLSGAKLLGTKLHLTLSDGTEIDPVDLTTLVDAVPTTEEIIKNIGESPLFLALFLKTLLKALTNPAGVKAMQIALFNQEGANALRDLLIGDEIKNIKGEVIGYLFPKEAPHTEETD